MAAAGRVLAHRLQTLEERHDVVVDVVLQRHGMQALICHLGCGGCSCSSVVAEFAALFTFPDSADQGWAEHADEKARKAASLSGLQLDTHFALSANCIQFVSIDEFLNFQPIRFDAIRWYDPMSRPFASASGERMNGAGQTECVHGAAGTSSSWKSPPQQRQRLPTPPTQWWINQPYTCRSKRVHSSNPNCKLSGAQFKKQYIYLLSSRK